MKKIFCLLLFGLLEQTLWAQSGEGYNPVNPADPDVYYTLTLETSPYAGGTISQDKKVLSAGQSTYVSASPRLGYEFKRWMMGDSVVSTNSGFYFTMPEKDVVLTAYFDWNPEYNPQNPGDPDADGYSHHVYAYAMPSAGGYFNSSSFTLIEGSTTNIYAYPREGYRFESWMCNGEVVSTENPLNIRMGTTDIAYTATFVYNPVSPGEPSPNVFNATTGEVVIDNFTSGSLNNTIYSLVGSGNYDKVQSILVIGRMQSSDFGFARSYRNCSLIDLSRTTGYTEVPSWSFEAAGALKEIFLPMNIERIGENAFNGCSALKDIYLYATTPPILAANALYGLDKSVTIHVPSASLALYSAAAGWNQLTIQSLDENEKSITVRLPGEAGEYKNMTLELQNMQSGQVYRCLVTDRTNYTFFGLMKNTYYNIYLKNSNGVVLGEINNVALENDNLNVNLSNIHTTHDVTLNVVTPDDRNVTADVAITWLDEQGSYLRQGNKVNELLTDTCIQYRVKLSKELAMEYVQPVDGVYKVKDGDNVITMTLAPIKQITMSGYVKDATTKQGISGATVSISQTLNGKYSKTIIAKTDSKGYYTATVYNAPTSMAISAYDYVNQTTEVAIDPSAENVTVDDIAMSSIIGATINVSLTYTPSVAEGETAETQNWYDDYQNVAYSIYNLTTDKDVTQVSVRYPQLVVLDGAKEGDLLEIKAVSKKKAFKDVRVELVADAKTPVDVVFSIKEFGGIKNQYMNNENAEVVGMLYDNNGYLKKVYNYANDATLSISGLQDGNYTLITMGKSNSFNSIYNLSRLKEILVEDEDYKQNLFSVESGVISIGISEDVPFFDENNKYIDKDKSYFNVGQTSLVAGNYQTFIGHIETNDVDVSALSNIKYIVDLPPSAVFVENSVMIGSHLVDSYTLEGNTLTILCTSLNKDNVKFCVIPTESGTYLPSATIAFTANDRETMLPIGCSQYEVKDISISVPATASNTSIKVTGTLNLNGTIDIFDNDVLIGQTTAQANGTWNTTCELNEPYNLSTHNIYAKVTTKAGLELISETKQVVYDINMIVPEKVTMLYYNPEFVGQYNIVFDLINGTVSPKSYYFFPYKSYPNWWGSGTEPKDFTFIADLSNNDSTAVNGVTIRVYTDNGYWRNLEAQYNTSMNRWVAVSQFVEEEAPVGVEVEIDANVVSYLDANVFEKGFEGAKDLQEAIEHSTSLTNELTSKIMGIIDSDKYSKEEIDALMEELLGTIYFNETISPNDKSVSDLLNETENLLSTDLTGIFNIDYNNFEEISNYLDGFSIETRSDLNEETLVNEGFQRINCTDGKEYYYKYTDNEYIIAYLPLSKYIVYNLQNIENENEASLSRMRRVNDVSDLTTWQGKVNLLCDKLNTVVSAVTNAVDGVISQVDALKGKCQIQLSENLGKLLQDAEDPFLTQKEINDLTKANAKLSKQIKQCEAISNWLSKNLKNFRVSNGAGVAFSLFDIYSITNGIKADGNEIINLYYAVPDCPKDSNDDNLRNRIRNWGIGCFAFYAGKLAADIVQINSVVVGVTGTVPTGGTSLTAVGIALGIAAASFAAELAYSWQFDKNKERFENEIRKIKCSDDKCPRCGKNPCECKDKCPRCGNRPCTCPDKCPKCGKNPCVCPPPHNTTHVQHDPSGYVYEGVSSNRLQGVTATCYYMETTEDMYGVLHDEPRVWDAEEYDQENPLYTDKDGFYQWFVPKGLWQVKFEKEGYETTYSEWLPVPPPQLEVNVGMVQSRQPEVKQTHAYKDGIEVEFDKYMLPTLLNTENILVSQNGVYVEGEVKLQNEETAYADDNVKYASKIRFVPTTPFTASEVTLTVANRVKSYAGLQMQDSYQQTFDIEQEIKEIVLDDTLKVESGKKRNVSILVLPKEAAIGKTMKAATSAEMITAIENAETVIDENGLATFSLSGELPGTAAVTYSVEGYDLEARQVINVNITDGNAPVVAVPIASIASGSSIYEGTSVSLSTTEPESKIYYTLDGSCPCNNTSRILYEGPITINSDVTVKAMTLASDETESDVVTYVYSILQNNAGVSLNNGWNWVSFNMKSDALANVNSAMTSGVWTVDDEIKNDKYSDSYSVAQNKWFGTLSKQGGIKNEEMYKIHSSQNQTLSLAGNAVNPSDNAITVKAGWNYIGYLPMANISLADALADYDALAGDVVKSQDAFATYSTTNGWEGDLTTMEVGRGYMLKRNAMAGQTSFHYPVVYCNSSSARKATLHYDFPDNMNVIGEVCGVSPQVGDSILALVGAQTRGAGVVDENGKVYLTIQGDDRAKATIVLQRKGEIVATANAPIMYQSNMVLGTVEKPTKLEFVDNPTETNLGKIRAIYNTNGTLMKTKELSRVPVGTYIIYSNVDGRDIIRKYFKKQ